MIYIANVKAPSDKGSAPSVATAQPNCSKVFLHMIPSVIPSLFAVAYLTFCNFNYTIAINARLNVSISRA